MATRRRAASLSNQPPDRAAGLGADWGPPPVPAAAPTHPVDTPAAKPAEPKHPRGDGPASRRPRITAGRIPEELFERINAHRDRTGETHEQWFALALGSVHDEVRSYYRGLVDPNALVPIPPRRARRPGSERVSQYALRLSPAASRVLEDLHEEVDPPSRSHFLTTIVRLRLAQLDGSGGAG